MKSIRTYLSKKQERIKNLSKNPSSSIDLSLILSLMTVKKAIKLLDFLIEYETRMYNGMSDPAKSWNIGDDCIGKLAKTLSDCHKDNIRILNIIKKELIPNCKHPKKMRDKTADGQLYYMNCNSDL